MSGTDQGPLPEADPDWTEIQDSAEFTELRRRLRGWVFPMTVAFLLWYLLYVLLSDYAHGFMSTKVFGNINIGLIFGLLQFVSTFLITSLYVRHANRKLDPVAEKIRRDVEGSDDDADTDVEGGVR
ncbi:MAG TPA: DUF485 domain-containing protein [Actinophytocola sp.]|nr:DUF485 domain-containing protein [Actinophytocola sp.]